MTGHPVAGLDATAVLANALAVDPALRAALDAYPIAGQDTPLGTSRVLADAVPPWPMLQVRSSPGGSYGTGRYLVEQEVQLSVWADERAGQGPPESELWHLCGLALQAALDLGDADAVPGAPVLSHVTVITPPQVLPDPTGQLRVFATVGVYLHG